MPGFVSIFVEAKIDIKKLEFVFIFFFVKEKSGCEKRKGGDSANSTLRRKGKKSKKSSVLCNKENVRVLLFSDAKKGSAQAKKVESAALNGKQMTRCNKSSAFKSINVNLNKRKYHKLQQPSVL